MSTEHLLDTNACIAIRSLLNRQTPRNADNARKLELFRQRWQAKEASALAMSLITLGELEFGAAKSTAADARERLAALRDEISVVLPDHAVAARYGEIRHALEAQGQGIGPNDTWIAAHGLALGLTVVTDNTAEFARVPGLKCESWMA